MGDRKYLITGVNGFIGAHMTNYLLNRQDQVYGLVRNQQLTNELLNDETKKKVKLLSGDVTNRKALEEIFKEERFDGVFHFAAQSHAPTSFDRVMPTFLVNSYGAVNLAEAIERFQPECALVYASSGEVYGNVEQSKQPITEETDVNPITPYGVGKASADLYVRERGKSSGLKFVVGRGFVSVGPGREKRFSVSSDAYQIARILKGMQEPVINVGNLSSRRAVIDVVDCVGAYHALMELAVSGDKRAIGEAYNIAGDKVYSMRELLDEMRRISGLEGKVEIKVDGGLVRKIDIPVQIPDTTKIKETTNWRPKIQMDQTLRGLLSYWDKKLAN